MKKQTFLSCILLAMGLVGCTSQRTEYLCTYQESTPDSPLSSLNGISASSSLSIEGNTARIHEESFSHCEDFGNVRQYSNVSCRNKGDRTTLRFDPILEVLYVDHISGNDLLTMRYACKKKSS